MSIFPIENKFFPIHRHKFLDFGKLEYLIHLFKFKIYPALFYVIHTSYLQQCNLNFSSSFIHSKMGFLNIDFKLYFQIFFNLQRF